MIFNPPPGWPPAPPGWQPPADWRPDPAWPPAPVGWQFWIPAPERGGLPVDVDGDRRALAAAERFEGGKAMLLGGGLALLGLIVTIVTFRSALRGGTYVVWWGAILFGGIQFFRGLGAFLSAGRRAREAVSRMAEVNRTLVPAYQADPFLSAAQQHPGPPPGPPPAAPFAGSQQPHVQPSPAPSYTPPMRTF